MPLNCAIYKRLLQFIRNLRQSTRKQQQQQQRQKKLFLKIEALWIAQLNLQGKREIVREIKSWRYRGGVGGGEVRRGELR